MSPSYRPTHHRTQGKQGISPLLGPQCPRFVRNGPEDGIDRLPSLIFRVGPQMRVGVEGLRCRRVTDAGLHDLDQLASPDEERRGAFRRLWGWPTRGTLRPSELVDPESLPISSGTSGHRSSSRA